VAPYFNSCDFVSRQTDVPVILCEHIVLIRALLHVYLQAMPIINIVPTEVHKLKLQDTLRTPVYVTSQRRNAMGVGLVFEADLRTTQHPSHWILQGVCLILNTD
jgi:dynein heavy chain, axonemal